MTAQHPVRARFLAAITELPAAVWDGLDARGDPFLSHAFLALLEETGCVGPGTGWQPCHLVLEQGERVLAAAPVYSKTHSYGEYVFDWAWAQACQRAGLDYYPKLVVAVPFTPVTGARLLLAPGTDAQALLGAAGGALIEHARRAGMSSVHWLFPDAAQARALAAHGWLARSGVQFHWHNAGYRDFEDYLASFTAEKRKKARRERRQVADAGVTLDVAAGGELRAADWRQVYRFYRDTVAEHGGQAYLNAEFFERLGGVLGSSVVLVRAWHGERWIGMALNLRGRDALYGRYWGSSEHVPGLHFEACYHRAVEWCIAERIARYEAGAQGEHKLARGFVPVETHSAHWLAEPRFAAAVDAFLDRERAEYAEYRALLAGHAPYRKEP